jgi:L-ascorbate metabolism protein UlaG (beta-lactamase superfamily)
VRKAKALVAVVGTALALAGITVAALLNWRPTLPGDLTVRSPAVPAQRGLQVEFFGTSTLLISDGQSFIMTDGFFSRPGWLKLVATKVGPDETRIDCTLSRGGVKHVDAIFVAHSHHDHAMDSAVVARKTGATVYGSESTRIVALSENLPPARFKVLNVCAPVPIGKNFLVTAFETPHSPNPLFPGLIAEPFKVPARICSFKPAQNYSFLLEHPLGNILIVPSTNFTPGVFNGVTADVVVLGIYNFAEQSEEFQRQYWDEVVTRTRAKLVIPIHWDDFSKSLEHSLVPFPYVIDNVSASMLRLRQLAAGTSVRIEFLPALQPVYLPRGRSSDCIGRVKPVGKTFMSSSQCATQLSD